MNRNNFLLILFLSLIVFIIACEDCGLMYENLLTEKQKSQIPFNGNEKIIFHDGQNLREYVGQEKIDSMYRQYPYTNESCSWYTEEHYRIIFKEEIGYLIFSLIANDDFLIIIRESEYKFLSSMNMDPLTGELSDFDKLMDSLSINNSLFYNIYKDTLVETSYPNNIPDSIPHPLSLYYSTEFGIVRIDYSDGTVWELQEIIWQE